MDDVQRADFLRSQHRAVLATRRSDGRPQLSPIVFATDESGRLMVSTRSATAKARNIRRDPRVSFCVITGEFFGDWAQVDGRASLVEMPEALAVLRSVYRAVAGEHPDWEEFDRDMVAQDRVVIVVEPDKP